MFIIEKKLSVMASASVIDAALEKDIPSLSRVCLFSHEASWNAWSSNLAIFNPLITMGISLHWPGYISISSKNSIAGFGSGHKCLGLGGTSNSRRHWFALNISVSPAFLAFILLGGSMRTDQEHASLNKQRLRLDDPLDSLHLLPEMNEIADREGCEQHRYRTR